MNWTRDGKTEKVVPPILERRGSMCQSCTNVRGEAFNVSAANKQKTITYRCPACSRTWDHTSPDSES